MTKLTKIIRMGAVAAVLLFAFYLGLVSLLSGWTFAMQQLSQFWFYLAFLAIGFGIQISLYSYIKSLHCQRIPKGVLATSSATSVLTMISCCAHYLINIIPLIGITGLVSIVNKYQAEIFQLGMIFSIIGMVYMARQVRKLTYTYEEK